MGYYLNPQFISPLCGFFAVTGVTITHPATTKTAYLSLRNKLALLMDASIWLTISFLRGSSV